MIVTDLRCGRQFIGDLVDEIPGNKAMSDEQLKTYMRVVPEDDNYAQYKKAVKGKRIVLKRHVGEGYWIIPINDTDYKVEA
jgi:hypothetical protein